KRRGCETCEITLDVGLGTFQPIHTETLEEHKIHSDAYEISAEAAEKIICAKKAARPVLAVGTTVVRALEDAAAKGSAQGGAKHFSAGRAEASLFIFPGHTFRVVDCLLTNFHLPKSTLLALVSAFAGRGRAVPERARQGVHSRRQQESATSGVPEWPGRGGKLRTESASPVIREQKSGVFPLLCEDENALFPPEAKFQHLAVPARNDFVVGYLDVALFPAAFGFRHDFFVFLNGEVIAVNEDAVIAGLNGGFAYVDGVRDG